MSAEMKHGNGRTACCLDDDGLKLAFHLCCQACRELIAERERVRMMAAAAVPDGCGSAIGVAPARGGLIEWVPSNIVPDGKDGWRVVEMGWRGRRGARVRDVFDDMFAQAARNGGSMWLTPAQIAQARAYRDIVEWHSAAGIRCSNVDMARGGSGSTGSFIDAMLAARDQISLWRGRVGDGVSLQVRRLRPSARGSRVSIRDIDLVDGVAIEGMTIDAVLRRHGWSVYGKPRSVARAALASALDRMSGL